MCFSVLQQMHKIILLSIRSEKQYKCFREEIHWKECIYMLRQWLQILVVQNGTIKQLNCSSFVPDNFLKPCFMYHQSATCLSRVQCCSPSSITKEVKTILMDKISSSTRSHTHPPHLKLLHCYTRP